MSELFEFWAKTKNDGFPGISVLNHCLNVGCVAELLLEFLPPSVKKCFPNGAVTLAAMHDVGKITLGFQLKCSEWKMPLEADSKVLAEAKYSPSDHALVSQFFLQKTLLKGKSRDWGIPVGSHHGRPKGRRTNSIGCEVLHEFSQQQRLKVTDALIKAFGELPLDASNGSITEKDSILWLVAGWITVADWIGSNEDFFPQDLDYDLIKSRDCALKALETIDWPGGRMKQVEFSEAFGFISNQPICPNPVQSSALDACRKGRFTIIEAPMGSGKTEAALYAAMDAICSEENHGFYFALPTQVTSNRIHIRIRNFLENTLQDTAQLRLAHSGAWLEDDFSLNINPSYYSNEKKIQVNGIEDENPNESIQEARSWFSSSKRALISPYGVGTVDQALMGVVAVKHFFVRRFALAGKVIILDEIHSYDVYTGSLIGALIRELIQIGCKVIVLSATLTASRRGELLEAAGVKVPEITSSYPLITSGSPGELACCLRPNWTEFKSIKIRCCEIPEEEVLNALIQRSNGGEQTLWIRNTVAEAQKSFALLKSMVVEDSVDLGLLHSRFTFSDRQKLENYWLKKLGKNRPTESRGTILIATQVVEQSVDIDLDFMISDLAPTDMLIQRLGRLWRHERVDRPCQFPEFWVRLPSIPDSATADEIKKCFGKSALVYDPYILLRTMMVIRDRTELLIPTDIRECLEATYCDIENSPKSWIELLKQLNIEKDKLKSNAESAMRVLDRPMSPDKENQPLTRRKGPPTVNVVLLKAMRRGENGFWILTGLDGASVEASEFKWEIQVARFIHRWMVKAPKNLIPVEFDSPSWLEIYSVDAFHFSCVLDDGSVNFNSNDSIVFYSVERGLFQKKDFCSTSTCADTNMFIGDEEDLDLYDDEFDY